MAYVEFSWITVSEAVSVAVRAAPLPAGQTAAGDAVAALPVNRSLP
jgi:hypothetical protein